MSTISYIRVSAVGAVIALGALAAFAGCAHRDALIVPADDSEHAPFRDVPGLALDTAVRGTAEAPAASPEAIFRGGPRKHGGFRFVPPRTATYRFVVRANFQAGLWIALAREGPRRFTTVGAGGGRSIELLATLAGDEPYSVIVEGQPPPGGAFELVARLDESAQARIHPEDPELARRQVAAAPRLVPGRTLGTFESVAAGVRARCGGLGSATVYAIDVAGPATLVLHAAAQFPIAVEVREPSGASLGCAHGDPDRFEVTLAPAVAAGTYLVVIDSVELAPEVFAAMNGASDGVKRPGAGVRGGFVLDVEVQP
jgi:hypothetical protein